MKLPPVVTPAEWQAAHEQLLRVRGRGRGSGPVEAMRVGAQQWHGFLGLYPENPCHLAAGAP